MTRLAYNKTTALRTGAAIIERLVLGAATFLVTILLGRLGGADELGLFMIFFPLLFIAIALQESLITAPYTVHAAGHAEASAGRSYLGSVLKHSLLLSVAASLVFLISAVVLEWLDYQSFAAVAAALALAAPCVLLREFARRVVYAELKPQAAILISGGVSALQLAMMTALYAMGELTAANSFLAMGASSLLVGAWWLFARRSSIQLRGVPTADAFWQNWELGSWSVATQVGEIVRTQMFPWLLAVALDQTTVGIFAACAVTAALVTPLHVALSNLLLPQFAQALKQGGTAAADRLMWQATSWLTAVMSVFLAVVIICSSWLVPSIYGSQFVGTQHALIVLTLAQVVGGASLPAARALFVMERPDQVFISHLVGIVVNMGLGLPMVYYWGVTGAAYATLIGAVLKAVMGGYWYYAHVHGQRTANDRRFVEGSHLASETGRPGRLRPARDSAPLVAAAIAEEAS
jgi:O-antigen/teichoic acid export membrane protein